MDFNYFRFNRSYYLQTKGVTMGSTYAPSAANLFMDEFESTYILNSCNNPFFEHISCYYHYISDIFCLYNDPPSYPAFQEWLNQLYPTIKFTFSGYANSVNFLDTTVFRTTRNTLVVKPFKKEIDKNSYLHFRSFHPRALHHNISYGQFSKIQRNATFGADYRRQAANMRRDFLARGYPLELVQDAANRSSRTQ